MSTRRELLAQAGAAAGTLLISPLGFAAKPGAAGEITKRNTLGRKIPRVKALIRREETVLRHGGDGDNWHMSWAADDRQYMSLCDGTGFGDTRRENYNSRLFAITGGPTDAAFHDVAGYPKLSYPSRGAATQGKNDARYYNFGTLATNNHLYQFMSTLNRPFHPTDMERPNPADPYRFIGAKLIYSPDNGRNWHNQDGTTPVTWERWGGRSRESMVFFGEDQEAFSIVSVLQMGKDYELNRDGYIYLFSPNGNAEGTMNELVMLRVPLAKLLDRGSYEYFAGRSVNGGARWSKDIEARAVVHRFPHGWVNTILHPWAWVPSISYNSGLGLYMMATWGTAKSLTGLWFDRPSYLGIWVAAEPWGPWYQLHEETAWQPANDRNARAFAPQISPKWIAADGKSFWLVWSDFQECKEQCGGEADEVSASGNGSGNEMDSRLRWRQEHPYYAFNVQRVDILTG